MWEEDNNKGDKMSIQTKINYLENELELAFELENATGEDWKSVEIAAEIERLRGLK
jgi:hypothetical protein